jgi:hypothetical protein
MIRFALILIIASAATACGGGEGQPCEPFANGPEQLITGCESGLVCVGSKGSGRCVRPDQPSGTGELAAPPISDAE